jgi:hypothetical protein
MQGSLGVADSLLFIAICSVVKVLIRLGDACSRCGGTKLAERTNMVSGFFCCDERVNKSSLVHIAFGTPFERESVRSPLTSPILPAREQDPVTSRTMQPETPFSKKWRR